MPDEAGKECHSRLLVPRSGATLLGWRVVSASPKSLTLCPCGCYAILTLTAANRSGRAGTKMRGASCTRCRFEGRLPAQPVVFHDVTHHRHYRTGHVIFVPRT